MKIFKIPPYDQNLSLNELQLEGNEKTLAELNIIPNSLICLRVGCFLFINCNISRLLSCFLSLIRIISISFQQQKKTRLTSRWAVSPLSKRSSSRDPVPRPASRVSSNRWNSPSLIPSPSFAYRISTWMASVSLSYPYFFHHTYLLGTGTKLCNREED